MDSPSLARNSRPAVKTARSSMYTRHYSVSRFDRPATHRSSSLSDLRDKGPSDLQALDLSSGATSAEGGITHALSTLRTHVLTYLSDLETRLAFMDFHSTGGTTTPNVIDSRVASPRPCSPAAVSDLQQQQRSAGGVADHAAVDYMSARPCSLGKPRVATPLIDDTSPATARLSADPIGHHDPVSASARSLSDASSISGSTTDVEDDSLLTRAGPNITDFLERAFEHLRTIRSELTSSIPEDFNVEHLAKFSHFEKPSPELRAKSSDKSLRSSLDGSGTETESWRSRLSGITPTTALTYVPRLEQHLASLHQHMDSLSTLSDHHTLPAMALQPPLPSVPPKAISDLLSSIVQGESEETIERELKQEMIENVQMVNEIKAARSKSRDGEVLITYEDLPHRWRNNEFMITGYRFIPISNWPKLLYSMFELHNETTNIHTHFLPLLSLLPTLIPVLFSYIPNTVRAQFISQLTPYTPALLLPHLTYILGPSSSSFTSSWAWGLPTLLPSNPNLDLLPATFFAFAAAACLLCSTIWHTFAGCADHFFAEAAARIDYIGIGWLISASVQSTVYYGFNCQNTPLRLYTALTMATGLAGTIVPFQSWFNERRSKQKRIAFFLSLCFASLLPFTHLVIEKGFIATLKFNYPIYPSLGCYLIGLCFYATHFPESHFPGLFDKVGGSHALWHVFIVMAIRSHYVGLGHLKVNSVEFACHGALPTH